MTATSEWMATPQRIMDRAAGRLALAGQTPELRTDMQEGTRAKTVKREPAGTVARHPPTVAPEQEAAAVRPVAELGMQATSRTPAARPERAERRRWTANGRSRRCRRIRRTSEPSR